MTQTQFNEQNDSEKLPPTVNKKRSFMQLINTNSMLYKSMHTNENQYEADRKQLHSTPRENNTNQEHNESVLNVDTSSEYISNQLCTNESKALSITDRLFQSQRSFTKQQERPTTKNGANEIPINQVNESFCNNITLPSLQNQSFNVNEKSAIQCAIELQKKQSLKIVISKTVNEDEQAIQDVIDQQQKLKLSTLMDGKYKQLQNVLKKHNRYQLLDVLKKQQEQQAKQNQQYKLSSIENIDDYYNELQQSIFGDNRTITKQEAENQDMMKEIYNKKLEDENYKYVTMENIQIQLTVEEKDKYEQQMQEQEILIKQNHYQEFQQNVQDQLINIEHEISNLQQFYVKSQPQLIKITIPVIKYDYNKLLRKNKIVFKNTIVADNETEQKRFEIIIADRQEKQQKIINMLNVVIENQENINPTIDCIKVLLTIESIIQSLLFQIQYQEELDQYDETAAEIRDKLELWLVDEREFYKAIIIEQIMQQISDLKEQQNEENQSQICDMESVMNTVFESQNLQFLKQLCIE